jgi:hypothetical protein
VYTCSLYARRRPAKTAFDRRVRVRLAFNNEGVGEDILTGGDASQVVRVGDTVRRPAGPWIPAVHAFLIHLREVGISGAPEVLGIDEHGREVSRYIPGQVATPSLNGLVESMWLRVSASSSASSTMVPDPSLQRATPSDNDGKARLAPGTSSSTRTSQRPT